MAKQNIEKGAYRTNFTVQIEESLVEATEAYADRFGLTTDDWVSISLLDPIVAVNITEQRLQGVPPAEQYQPVADLLLDETPPAFFVPYGPVPALRRHHFDSQQDVDYDKELLVEAGTEQKPPTIELLPDSNPGAYWTHTVVAGDTLSNIAAQYYGDSGQFPRIAQANSIFPPYSIYVGETLIVPKPELDDVSVFTTGCEPWQNHLVRAGETLGNIAAQYYGSSGEYWRIANCNNVQPPNYIIYAGDVLAIPARYV